MGGILEVRHVFEKRRLLLWVVIFWAIAIGCVVTDLFVCPWTAVFPKQYISSQRLP